MDEQLERIKEDLTYLANSQNKIVTLGISDYEYVIQQAKKVPELEGEIQNLKVYRNESSKFHVDLNEFLQKRYKEIPIKKFWGRHVVDVAMDYIQQLEEENQRHKETLEFYANEENYKPLTISGGKPTPNGYKATKVQYPSEIEKDNGEKARQELKRESL